jgi:soluble lytic murein transglycosylase-like protein
MAIQLGLSAHAHQPLGLRRSGDRRLYDRRAQPRGEPDRRRTQRRRTTMRSVVIGALTFASPQQAVQFASHAHIAPAALQAPVATVTVSSETFIAVSIDSFVAVPPHRAYDALIREAARRYALDGALIRSVMQAESAFNPMAVSNAGAMGLMQLMPELAAELRVTDPFDPRQNIMAGARHLRRLLELHNGDITLAVASYNAGEGAVERYGAVPPFVETQDYVKRVTYSLARATR